MTEYDGLLTEIQFWSMMILNEKRTVLVSPENESRVKSWIAARGLSEMYPVQVSRAMDDDKIYLIDTDALDAAMNQSYVKVLNESTKFRTLGPWWMR